MPAELATREGRLKKIREAKAALEAEARKKAEAEGKDPRNAKPPDKAQRNFTDPESKIQKTSDGFIQGYNAQVAVDDLFQVIDAQHVTPAPRGRMPKTMTARERMARKLRTRQGRESYSWRKILAEPVIGQIKQARGFRQFLRRGVVRVSEEWALVCTAHNLLKLHTAMKLV